MMTMDAREKRNAQRDGYAGRASRYLEQATDWSTVSAPSVWSIPVEVVIMVVMMVGRSGTGGVGKSSASALPALLFRDQAVRGGVKKKEEKCSRRVRSTEHGFTAPFQYDGRWFRGGLACS